MTIAVTLASTSAAIVKKDVVCLVADTNGNRVVTKATQAALLVAGKAYGFATAACAAGERTRIAVDSILPSSATGLAAGAGVARVNTSTARAERRTSFTVGDWPLGSIDAANDLYFSSAAAIVAGDPFPGFTITSIQTDDYTAAYNEWVSVDPTGGDVVVQLPSAAGREGEGIVVENESDSTNLVTILPYGAELIAGRASIEITEPRSPQVVISKGDRWSAQPGPIIIPVYDFHELVANPTNAWDAADITTVGLDIATWPARVGGSTLTPSGNTLGYLDDDGGYPSATFGQGGVLAGPATLTSGTDFGMCARFRLDDLIAGGKGCVVGFIHQPTGNATWSVLAPGQAQQYGQMSLSGGDNLASASETLAETWHVGFFERAGATMYLMFDAGATQTGSAPAGTASLDRINIGQLVYSGASILYPLYGAVSHVVTVSGRRFTSQERADLAAWTPPT